MYKLIITKDDQVISSTTLTGPPSVKLERLDWPERIESWTGMTICSELLAPPRFEITVSGVGI